MVLLWALATARAGAAPSQALSAGEPPVPSLAGSRLATVGAELAIDHEAFWVEAQFDAQDRSLLISNRGTETLDYEVRHQLDWIRLDHARGTVGPRRGTFLLIRAEAWFVPVGDYVDTLEILSNDPVRPRVLVPVSIHQVMPHDPARALLPVIPVVIGAGVTGNPTVILPVRNEGWLDLALRPMRSPAWLAMAPGTAIVRPHQTGGITATASPAGFPAGTIVSDTLWLQTNDPWQPALALPVELRVGPPVLSVSPDSLAARVIASPAPVGEIQLSNAGGETVRVELAGDKSWLGVSPAVVTIGSAGTASVTVLATFNGTTRGIFEGHVRVQAAGGVARAIDVPVRVDVDVVAPRLTVSPGSLLAFATPGQAASANLRLGNAGGAPLRGQVSGHAGWLSLAPGRDVALDPGESRAWVVNLQSERGVVKEYSDTLEIVTNDPLTPRFRVPVRLSTWPRPQLEVSGAQLSGRLRTGQVFRGSVRLRNSGGQPLHLAFAAEAGWIGPREGALELSPGAWVNQVFALSAAGLAAGTYVDTLVITSDDPVTPTYRVPVDLTVLNPQPPFMYVVSWFTSVERQRSQPRNLQAEIHNLGDLPLRFQLAHWPEWLLPVELSGQVPETASRVLELTLSPSLETGTYADSVVITSNSPGREHLVLPVRLRLLEDIVRVEPERVDIGMPASGAPGRGAFRIWNISTSPVSIAPDFDSRWPGLLETVVQPRLEPGEATLVEVELAAGSQPAGERAVDCLVYAVTDSNKYVPLRLPVRLHVTSETAAPNEVSLDRLRPNPSAAAEGSSWTLTLNQAAPVRIMLFDASGRRVRQLLDVGRMSAGASLVRWDGRDDNGHRVAGGLYFLRLVSGDIRLSDRLTIVD